MFELMNKLDHLKPIGVAFSGGVDSVVLAEYLLKKKFNVTLFFFDHLNGYSTKERTFALQFAQNKKLPIVIGHPSRNKVNSESTEEHWRKMRYEFFHNQQMDIATGHTLNDVVEWYLFTCMHGEGHVMPYQNKNVIRPFLLTSKDKIVNYAETKNIEWLEDWSNSDIEFAARNRIRHNILPEALKINPGLFKVVKKKLLSKWRSQ
jgi:tRNA(Ile)-lysidine synthase